MPADAEQDLVGAIGRVTVPIPADGPGEVFLPVRGGTEAFAAWADQPIEKHARVLVIEAPSARSASASSSGRPGSNVKSFVSTTTWIGPIRYLARCDVGTNLRKTSSGSR